MRAVIYARYSSANQRDESIEGQLRECNAYAQKRGYKVVNEYVDKAISATTDKRPSFQQMIRESERRGFDVVLCYKHDRFARNRYDAALYKAKLKANNVAIEYAAEVLPEGPDAIIIDSIMEGFAEYYSANLSQNVRRGLYDSALKRYTLGVRALGLKEGPDKRFALDENAPVVAQIYADYAAGRSAKSICEELNARGCRTARGAKFTKNSVALIIRNERYKGVYRYADIYDENGIPAIVSPELWEKANAMLQKHKEAPALSADEGGYILSGRLFCGECGATMTSGGGKSKTGRYYSYYSCNGRREKNGCKIHNIPKDYLEGRVLEILRGVCFSDAIIREYADRYVAWQEEQPEAETLSLMRKKLAQLERRIENAVALLVDMPESTAIREKLVETEKEKASLSEEIRRIESESVTFSRGHVIHFLKAFREGNYNSPEWSAEIVRELVRRCTVFDDGRIILELNFRPPYNGLCCDITSQSIEVTDEFVKSSIIKGSALPYSANSKTALYFVSGSLFAVAAG